MRCGCKKSLPIQRQTRRTAGSWSAAAVGLALVYFHPAASMAQQQPLYITGDAAVTGFSGALPPIQIAPGVDPNTLTFIDPNGPSLRVIDLHAMGGPAAAQLVGAPKPFTVPAAQIGQVFGVTLDDSAPPDIFAAATSAYGLAIVAPGTGGQPQHIQAGAPNATFMPGLWGPQGGPGSIWKINTASGQASLLANVTFNGRPNSGAALGALAYDPGSKSLYASDRETGLIYQFDLSGNQRKTYDHGVTGRDAQGLPPVAWTASPGIDVTSPQFDSTQPGTWNYAPAERLIFGLAVYQNRLYYAVADGLQIWSVGLNSDGSFGTDAVIELAVPASAGPTEISKITFDEQGRMFLAERPAVTGAFDFEALAVPSIGRVLRYALIGTTGSGQRLWQQSPDEFAIGFPAQYRNDNGGVAIGYSYDANGNLNPGSCGGFMWSTGEDLRDSSDVVLAAQLSQSGEVNVTGLQGNGTWLAEPANAPPLQSYFVDYADEYPDPAARGHMGDIAIARQCAPRPATVAPPPPLPTGFTPGPPGAPPACVHGHCPPPPKPSCPPNQSCGCMPWQICGPGGHPVCPPNQVIRRSDNTCVPSCERPNVLINGQCCTVGALAAGGACSNSSCPAGQTAVGASNFCCSSSQVYKGQNGAAACCSGAVVNGKCQPPITIPKPTPLCGIGYVSTGNSCCLKSQMTSNGTCCPQGSAPNKTECVPIIKIPIGKSCCPSGQIPSASGACCPAANLSSLGVCCSSAITSKNRSTCPIPIQKPVPACSAGYAKMPDGSCCLNRDVGRDGKTCVGGTPGLTPAPVTPLVPLVPILPPCPGNQIRDSRGECAPPPSTNHPACPAGEVRARDGNCVPGKATTPPRALVPVKPARPVLPSKPPPAPRFRAPAGGRGFR